MPGVRLTGFLGGVAVGFGIWLAMGIAGAQPASAAPAGSSDNTSAHSATSARNHKTAAARRPAAARVAPNTTKRPVATTRQPTAATSARNPLRHRIVIFKNTHLALPPQMVFFAKRVAGNATFTDSSVYDLQTADQYDWNKLTGISFTLLRPDTDAIMVAWRYNVTTQMFEVGPYYNVDTARIMPTASEIVSVPVGQTFTFTADYQGITVQYGDTLVYKPIPEGLHPNQLSAFRINSWFGGTSRAPKTISFNLDLKPWWTEF
ncbi:hypothetical protein [Mycolicibacterium rhodesiae]|uniref:Uncharacterized protein n=1 Tax=Mycolicibacterium rhodesiae TaxID=36814 RepID=A0A1X0IW22_MYCRH|nr:hypothetical protein [Mycolicibacterium rhodesiae]MCV7343237.1 hypothetical protein [Mycolicibacterium rhodesiae]ORB53129.1 hypothetical protein BST42_14110 [Mycolicibacterium rhodesiae]